VRELVRSAGRIAAQLRDVREQAEALGIFCADRELLECPSCGLVEDVACDGRLMTYKPSDGAIADTGLRFEEADECRYRCPECGTLVAAGASSTHVAEYLTALPPREILQQKLHAAIALSRKRLESRTDTREAT